MKKNKCTISIDWMQVLCRRTDYRTDHESWFTSSQTNQYGHHNTYILKDAVEWTIGYEYCKTVYLKDTAIAHVGWSPRRSNVNEMNCSIKLTNNLLYTNMWHFMLGDICNALGWQIQGITRVDLACDLNFFLHGLNPEAFISKYVRGKYSSYIRTKSNKFSVVGEKTIRGSRIDYIRWGTRSSGVCTYLYNKSKEMTECTMKPWIIERWRNAGLDIRKVWRVEFSINSNGKGLRDLETGIIHNLFIDDMDTQERLVQIFHTYAKRYFNFKRVVASGPKYVKDMQSVELLDVSQALEMKPCQLYSAIRKSASVETCIMMIEQLKPSETMNTDKSDKKKLESIEIVQDMLLDKLRETKMVDEATSSIENYLSTRIKHHVSRICGSEKMTQYNSFMSDELYKESVCQRTALRITKLLMSRRGQRKRAYF